MRIRLFLGTGLLLFACGWGCPTAASAQAAEPRETPAADASAMSKAPANPDDVPRTIPLTLLPAAEPRPALRYRLLPTIAERRPGNAAPMYYRAMLHQKELPQAYWQERNENTGEDGTWMSTDPAVFPAEKVRAWLDQQRNVMNQIREAAYRETCDWDMRIQDLRGMETIQYLLHDMQQARELARTIQLEAHYQTMTGHYDEAFETLRLGYQLARDVGQNQFLIGSLVGIAINAIMNQELLHLIERTDANYYWAIVAMPDPLVNMRQALEFEANMPFQIYPFLADAETAERTADEWRRLIVDCIATMQDLEGGQTTMPRWQAELAAAAMSAKLYPVAKEALIAEGMDAEKVERMPVGQVIAIHTARITRATFDDTFKLSFLSAEEANRRWKVVEDRLRAQRQDVLSGQSGIPLAAILLPAIGAVRTAETRMSRDRAALQTIEALRMHAAVTGSLPAKLADVAVVPVPANPATGQPFSYSYDASAKNATLEIPQMHNMPARHDARRYVIELAAPPAPPPAPL
ncbi:MAG: hypothetical protein MUF06_13865 [Pirellulaceae bacterium]|nr:hypothetical protein [Pirellulaceae bacterium]